MKLEIKILKHKLNIASNDSEDEEYLKELASYVEKIINEINLSKAGKYPETVIAILAALNIADELKRNQTDLDSLNKLNSSISKKVTSLIEMIDSID